MALIKLHLLLIPIRLMIAVCDDDIRECLYFNRQVRTVLDKIYVPCMIKQYNSGKELLQATEAFEYPVKPVDEQKLKRVPQRCISKTDKHSDSFIIFSKDHPARKLFPDEIRYFEIHGRLIEAHGKNPTFSWYKQTGTLEAMLSDKNFFRCHKSYLINLKYVDVYNRQEATPDNGEKILIARRRYESFCTAILQYV